MKTCKCGCNWPVFSHGYAKYCQYKRTDKKKSVKIAVHTSKRPVQDFSFGFDSQVSLFDYCWENAKNRHGEVICKYTGEKLNRYYNTDMFLSCFAHMLPKGRYTYFKYNPDNIKIVLPALHAIIDQGTLLDRVNHPAWLFDDWDKEVEDMKILYQKYKNKNLLA